MPLSTINKWRGYYHPFILIALITLLLQWIPLQRAEASFISRQKKPAAPREAAALQQTRQHGLGSKLFNRILLKKAGTLLSAPPYGYGNDPVFGIISLTASVVGLAFLGLFFIGTGAGALLAAGLIMAVVGIVFGAIGLRKPMNGLAIAGMVLGILEIVAAVIGLIIVLATIAAFSGC